MKTLTKTFTALALSLTLSANVFADTKKDNPKPVINILSPTMATLVLVDVESRDDLSQVNFQDINKQLKTSANTSDVSSLYGTVVGQRVIVLANSATSDLIEYNDMTKNFTPEVQGGAAPNDMPKHEWNTGVKVSLNITDVNDKKVNAYINFVSNTQVSTDPKTNQYSIKSATFKNTLLLNKNEYQLVTINSIYNEDPSATKQKSKIQFVYIKIQK